MRKYIILLFLAALIVAITESCGTTKHIRTEETVMDSSAFFEMERVYKAEHEFRLKIEQQLKEMTAAGVYFDTLYVPGDTVRQKVIIHADGRIEAEGRLKAAYYSYNKIQNTLHDLQEKYDSLEIVKQKKLIEKKVTTKVKEVEKVKKIIPWWLYLLIIGGFAAGYYASSKIKKKK
jgi:hypothetical protein